jgi:hypothetical protein
MTTQGAALLLTDLALGAVAGVFAWSLHRALPGNRAARWWSRALGLIAVAAVVGGFFHASAARFAAPVQSTWWVLTLLLSCGVSLAMDLSLLHTVLPTGLQVVWRAAVAVKFAAFALVAIVEAQFWVAIASYASSLLLWTAAALAHARVWRGWMLAGIGLSVVAAIVQMQGWNLSVQLDHNDLYHLIQAVALYGFYRAGRLFAQT